MRDRGVASGFLIRFAVYCPNCPRPPCKPSRILIGPAIMKSLLDGYTDVKGYGSETYWGGKKILLYAKYMEMAYQTGQTHDAQIFQARLKEALVDWATYEPGEREHFSRWYPNWGSMVGERTRDNQNPGIDVLQDHAFCYGYHVYAASLLAIHDPNFAPRLRRNGDADGQGLRELGRQRHKVLQVSQLRSVGGPFIFGRNWQRCRQRPGIEF